MIDPRYALAQAGDESALAALTAEHDGLVHWFLRPFHSKDPAISYEDMLQAGRQGLIDAIRRFEPTRAAFSSFAKFGIRGAILHVLKQQRGVREPHVSWETNATDQFQLSEVIADDRQETAHQTQEHTEQQRIVHEALAGLPPRERDVLTRWIYGNQNLKEIAAAFGVSRQMVHLIRQRACRRLRTTGALDALRD